MTSSSGASRRQLLAVAAAAATAPLIAGTPVRAAEPKTPTGPKTWDLTVLGTSDTHGNVYNWDYYRDAEFDDSKHNDVGIAKLATLVDQVRAERRGRATLVLDAGDTIQGTPLATYYAKQEPITDTGATHPMARAMNILRYDAVTLGNHEFNYGLPLLATWIDQLGFPALAANAVNARTGKPAFQPYVLKRVRPGGPGGPTLTVGILGLTNPGWPSGTRATSRAGWSSPTWCRPPRSGCRSCGSGALTWSSSPPTAATAAPPATARSCPTRTRWR